MIIDYVADEPDIGNPQPEELGSPKATVKGERDRVNAARSKEGARKGCSRSLKRIIKTCYHSHASCNEGQTFIEADFRKELS